MPKSGWRLVLQSDGTQRTPVLHELTLLGRHGSHFQGLLLLLLLLLLLFWDKCVGARCWSVIVPQWLTFSPDLIYDRGKKQMKLQGILMLLMFCWTDNMMSVLHFGPKWNVLTTIEWIPVTLGADISVLHRTTSANFLLKSSSFPPKTSVCDSYTSKTNDFI